MEKTTETNSKLEWTPDNLKTLLQLFVNMNRNDPKKDGWIDILKKKMD